MVRFNQINHRFSLICLTLCYLIMFYTGSFFYPKWNKGGSEATLSWDVSGYYMYLPAIFIYGDLKECKFQTEIGEKYSPTPHFEQARLYNHTTGRIMQYTYGQAIAMAPFFFLAHIYNVCSQLYPSDGFSYPYQVCIGLGMFCYSLIALLFLRKILLQYFSDKTTGILLVFTLAGSPLLNYLSIDQAQANPFLFFLYTLIIYLSINFYASPSFYKCISLSILCGFATIIRPTDIICILIPLLWGVNNLTDFKHRVSFWISKIKWVLIAIIPFILFAALQMSYWQYVLGEWVVYPYQNQGFSWLRPHFFSYFFSPKSGFLAYSPSMILAYIGLLYYVRNGRERWTILALIFISHYIIAAWDGVDYGWYSGRAMIQYFPLLAFPLATLIEKSLQKTYTKIVFVLYFLFSVYFNIWWTYHIHKGNIGAMNLTKTEYLLNIGRW